MEEKGLISQVKDMLPSKAMIEDHCFEGANIVLYTKSKDFLMNGSRTIKKIVDTIKKRVELRADQSILLDPESADEKIRKIVPKEADIGDIWFDEKRSIAIVEAMKPGLVIGKQGSLINDIKDQTLWIPKISRSPAINSDLIRTIRLTLYQNSDYRRKFLHKIGERVYTPWQKDDKYWIRLSCLGGFREVGRSCMLLQTPESKVMLDCGVNVASEAYAFPYLEAPEFNIKDLDAVVVTHSHLDHIGFLPYLYKYGYRGPTYCTEPTRDVMVLLQIDYVDVAQREGKKLIYDSRDIKEMVKHTVCLDYGEVTDISADMRLTLHNAGHVLGSSAVHLNIGNGFHNLLYTGDHKFSRTKLLEPLDSTFTRLETLITESTYGSKQDIQPTRKECESQLLKIVSQTTANGGKVLVPVLGVGRAQEIMLVIEEAIRKGLIPDIPVYVDGMVWDITAIHTTYPEYMNRSIRKLVFGMDHNPFLSKCFRRVGSHKERQDIIGSDEPCLILATSGMLTGGPSVEYLRNLAENDKNSLIFVSYQAEGSLGRSIQKGEEEVYIETHKGKIENVKIKLSIDTISGFSGHSDFNELVNFIKLVKPKPKRVIIAHGENSKCLELASTLHRTFRIETTAPRDLDAIRIR